MHASRRARIAWSFGGGLLAFAAIGWGALSILDLLAHQRDHFHATFPTAEVRTVSIDVSSGSVRIQGTNQSGVTIDGTRSRGLTRSSHSERVEGDQLVIKASCAPLLNTFCGVDYRLTVPEGVAVVASVHDASIRIGNVHGALDVSSTDGSIRVDGAGVAGAPARFHSSDGSITGINLATAQVEARSSDGAMHLTFVQPPQTVQTRSSDGSVTIVVPNTSDAYRVDASSSGSSVHTSIRTDPTSSRVISAHTADGRVTIRYPSQA
jgi:hypothetical protein